MIFQAFCVTALGVLQIVYCTSEGGRKYRSLGRVNFSENLFRCPTEGFYPDARNCRTFYRCVDWTSNDYFRDYTEPQLTAFRFECSEGTVFDPDYNVCNHPRDTRRAECGGKQPDGNSGGYAPSEGGDGQGFYPSQPGQGGYPGQGGLPSENENHIMTSSEGGTNQTPLGLSENCQSSGFYSVKGDCQKFIRCVDNGKGGYTKYEFSCGPGTVWDSANSVCNYPSQVPGCGGSSEGAGDSDPEGSPGQGGYPGPGGSPGQGGYPGPGGSPGQGGYPGPGGSPGQGGQPGPGGSPGQGGYPGPGGSPGQNGNPFSEIPGQEEGGIFSGKCAASGFYGVPGNCKKFIRCVDKGNGGYNQYDFECAPGTAWDVKLNTCNHASMVKGCENSNKVPAEETGQESLSESGMPGQGGYPKPEQPGQGGYPGPGMPGQGGYPKPEQPGQGGYPGPGMPGQGGYSEIPDSSNESQKLPSGNPSECQNDGFYPVKNNCKAFFRCVSNGKDRFLRYDFQCGEGTLWDQENQVCNYPWAIAKSDSNCAMSSANQTWSQTTSSNSSSSTFSQSTSYYNTSTSSTQNQFSNSSTTVQTGLSQSQSQSETATSSQTQGQGSQASFNQETSQYPGSRPTGQGSTKPMLPQSKPTTEIPMPETPSPEDPSKPPPGSSPCDKNKIPSQVKCEKDGFYPDPSDCSKFYRCAEWGNQKFSVYYFECGKGTIWDPAIETCNYEKSVYPPRECSNPSDESKEPGTAQKPPSSAITDSNKVSTTKKPVSSTSNTAETTKEPFTSTSSSIESSTIPQSTTTDSQISTGMPTIQASSTEATDLTSSITDQTESIANPTEATSVPESTSQPTSTAFSTDSTESTTKVEATSEMTTESTTNPNEEPTESSTVSQTESTTSSSESTESVTSSANTEPTESTTPSLNTESTDSTESTTSQGSVTTETPNGGDPNCPQLNPDQSAFVCPTGFRRHPKDCNLFYQCTMSKDTGDINIMVLSCKNNTMYDERKIQCLPPGETDACQSQGQGRRVYRRAEDEFSSVVYVSPYKRLCPEEGSFAYEGDCTRFYKCKKDRKGKIQGYLYQCPDNYSFHDSIGKCEKSSKLPQCTRSMPEVTIKSKKWMRSKVPVEYSNLAFR